ncbi:Aste57867_6906 [Aphanomyces stellatus]|uniref:Aste57867_5684 protein n=1 Tax=Aphanomyces stellatus TaxID=120398 RepID=A0A485KG60_9STRA|nr:hypothetical protein As57867_006884 [Aphanomyces stellatus]KAF0709976.1 hypothetical protein As57867_005671 [Aphanomyces stellatus]VFT82724.1 Aste57867_5684 [Aphanomyces stellatus]VFT83858.1 Aste57867_6906 [Aphanomyces stellatus]
MMERARLEKNRVYYRNFMRSYRQRAKDEAAQLRAQVTALELALSQEKPTTSSSGALPWKDVAEALRQDAQDMTTRNAALKKKSKDVGAMAQALYAWVVATTQIPISPKDCLVTWRNTTLLADTDGGGRRRGKAWIMEHMYANTDVVFQQRKFPSWESNTPLFDVNVQFSDACFEIVACRQYTRKRNFDKWTGVYFERLLQNMLVQGFTHTHVNTIVERTETTCLHQTTTLAGEFVNLLAAEFRDMDRYVLVVQNIIHDEAIIVEKKRQRRRCMWLDVRRIDNETIKVRTLYIVSQAFGDGGQSYVPLVDDAPQFYCDLNACAEERREQLFRRRVLQIFNESNLANPAMEDDA